MSNSRADDLDSGLMVHTLQPATARIQRWKKEIGEMNEAELVLAAALIGVRRAELNKAAGSTSR